MNHGIQEVQPLTAPSTARRFTVLLSPTRRGARLARLLTVEQLRTWEVPFDIADRAEQIVAELAANAALHGRVRGRDFRVELVLDAASSTLRIEVTDARGDRMPSPVHVTDPDGESGRGLLLVAALADRWGTQPHPPGGKTVWAEVGPGAQ
ncbi:ATP-binding protein [Streptantibioticus ferralitis]|uniref:ATP-binding protein n=1 Tax=Streptantibioticus ferralitis TaxID=236510 RepID=A0ABT5YWI4_9ACTN|nr:ATP-binding protein [Streptantibioticus ferralitis]MDF2255838.1 ATP-binding protein [Streptantibioticus ferralitis]